MIGLNMYVLHFNTIVINLKKNNKIYINKLYFLNVYNIVEKDYNNIIYYYTLYIYVHYPYDIIMH